MDQFIVVMTNVPDDAVAMEMARQLVEQKLAACVNRLSGVRSIYRWQGVIEEADEVTLLIKTTQKCYDELEAEIKALHPYQVPEIIVLPIVGGSQPYLDWIVQETKKDVNV